MSKPRSKLSPVGFTLTEMAVVLVIVALLLGGLVVPFSAQYDARYTGETQRQLSEAKEALLGFVITKGYFPCPADTASANGLEGNRTSGQCDNHAGLLPWATLGITHLDSWGRQLHYSVTKTFTNNSATPSPSFSLTSNGDITIKGESGAALTSSNTVVAVVLSHGKNGALGTADNGTVVANSSTTNADEQENGNTAGTTFHDRIATLDTTASGGEIDDIVTWIPTATLMHRLVIARRLP